MISGSQTQYLGVPVDSEPYIVYNSSQSERTEMFWQRLDKWISAERPNMKQSYVNEATDTMPQMPGLTPSDEKGDQVSVESDLTPKRIADGAINTALLNQILAQREALHQVRDWGINE